jgi:DNA-binding transcriptional MerR regulator/methylmalonyl-CoA mutase cobalamin-binding subunit
MAGDRPDVSPTLYAIGDVARATGISESTIRVWERRYGRPKPAKTVSGHRRYSDEDVRWLRRVAEALALGHRPRFIVSASDDALQEILLSTSADSSAKAAERFEMLIRNLRSADLVRLLRRAYRELGFNRFMAEYAEPLVVYLGRAWVDGDIDIQHEHLASSALEDVLRSLRIGSRKRASGPVLVLTTLAGERHTLGLQMAALVAADEGCRCRFLGADLPNDKIAAAAHDSQARGVAVSVSLATGGVDTDRQLADLRARLPAEVRLAVGGSGARGVRRGLRGIQYMSSFDRFRDWLRALGTRRRITPHRV